MIYNDDNSLAIVFLSLASHVLFCTVKVILFLFFFPLSKHQRVMSHSFFIKFFLKAVFATVGTLNKTDDSREPCGSRGRTVITSHCYHFTLLSFHVLSKASSMLLRETITESPQPFVRPWL